MKAITSRADSRVYEKRPTVLIFRVFLCLSLFLALLTIIANIPALAQTGTEPVSQASSPGLGSNGSSTTIGGTGFKVPIPEIRMNRIIGDSPHKSAPSETGRGSVSHHDESPKLEPLHPEENRGQMQRPGPVQMRLPFDPGNRRRESEPNEAFPSIKEELQQEPGQTVPQAVERPFHRGGPTRNLDRQYEPVTERQPLPVTKEQSVPEEKPSPRAPDKRREPQGRPFKEPISPVNITDSLPEPNKEIIPKRMIPLPNMLEVETARDTIRSLPVEADSVAQYKLDPDVLQMETRKSPLLIEIEEPEVSREAKEEPSLQGKQRESVEPDTPQPPKTTYEPMTPPDAGQGITVIPPKEPSPSAETKSQEHPELPSKEESTTQVERPETRHKERIPSPLDGDTATTPEIRRYLKETAPVLEELSLLMARTPALSIADFDPSDSSSQTLPRELNLKMESMKRDLRILDSKMFSIIPPPAYSQYHDLLRQSINHTYLATEAFINFANESRIEDLNQVREHLAKAKEFIHQTVE